MGLRAASRTVDDTVPAVMVERRCGSEWKTRWKAPSRAAGDVGVQSKVHDLQPKLAESQAT